MLARTLLFLGLIFSIHSFGEETWHLLRNRQGQLVGAMYFAEGDPLARHAHEFAENFSPSKMILAHHSGHLEADALAEKAKELKKVMAEENGRSPGGIFRMSCWSGTSYSNVSQKLSELTELEVIGATYRFGGNLATSGTKTALRELVKWRRGLEVSDSDLYRRFLPSGGDGTKLSSLDFFNGYLARKDRSNPVTAECAPSLSKVGT